MRRICFATESTFNSYTQSNWRTKKTELQGISSSGGPSLDKTQHNGIDIAKITLNIMESYKFYFTMTWVGKWTLFHV